MTAMEVGCYGFIFLAVAEAVIIFYMNVLYSTKSNESKIRGEMIEEMGDKIEELEWELEKDSRKIMQFEKELRLYTTIIREHGLEVKDEYS